MRSAALLALALVSLAGCSGNAPPPPPASPPPQADAVPAPVDDIAQQDEIVDPIADGTDGEGDPEPTPPEYDPAPWSGAKLAAGAVAGPYLQEWRKAQNRARCAPLAPADLGEHGGATPRRANFSGGWAVAYDEPGLRSAFGIAGAGVVVDEDDGEYPWPDGIAWADGSRAGYGLEGGTGPGHLAYLRVEGQGCLYNVWSKHGEAHLLELLSQLRFVEIAG
jgi:hypothetical protein